MKIKVITAGKPQMFCKSYFVCEKCECEFEIYYKNESEYNSSLGMKVECPNCYSLIEINN